MLSPTDEHQQCKLSANLLTIYWVRLMDGDGNGIVQANFEDKRQGIEAAIRLAFLTGVWLKIGAELFDEWAEGLA